MKFVFREASKGFDDIHVIDHHGLIEVFANGEFRHDARARDGRGASPDLVSYGDDDIVFHFDEDAQEIAAIGVPDLTYPVVIIYDADIAGLLK